MPDPVSITYPFDPTGILQTNKIIEEQHTVTESNYRDYYFIIPNFAPFFADNIVVKYAYQGDVRVLVENVDYYCALLFIGATRAIGKPVYGAITLNNLNTAGLLSITYNTLGGTWNVDQQFVIEQIAEKAYNPRTASWEHIVDVPTVFPPIPHEWELVDLVGQTEVVSALAGIETAILTNSTNAVTNHASRFDNPHRVTKAQLGIENVGNWSIASETDMTEGTSNVTLITPSILKAQLQQYSLSSDVQLQDYYLKTEVDVLFTDTMSNVNILLTDLSAALTIALKPPIASRAKAFFLAQS